MLEQSSNIGFSYTRQVILIRAIKEGVSFTLEQRLVSMHAGPVLTEDGFGHESGVEPTRLSHLFDRQPIGHDVIRHGEGVRVAKIYLVLRGGDFMVGIFHLQPQFLKSDDGIPTQIRRHIQRSQIEIPPMVEYLGAFTVLEVEVLQLRPQVHGEAHAPRLVQQALEHITLVAREGGTVRRLDVTEHARSPTRGRPPGKYCKYPRTVLSTSSLVIPFPISPFLT